MTEGLDALRDALRDALALAEEFDNGRFVRRSRGGAIVIGRRPRRGERMSCPDAAIILYCLAKGQSSWWFWWRGSQSPVTSRLGVRVFDSAWFRRRMGWCAPFHERLNP